MGEYKRQNLIYEKADLQIEGPGKYPDYNFWRVAGMAIGGKDKGEAEHEVAAADPHSLMPSRRVMFTLFYLAGIVAVVATLLAITRRHAVHALLYLVVSLLAVAVVFYLLGAVFVAALEVMIYAGAIMVLFVFVVMMLNVAEHSMEVEREWLRARNWYGPSVLALILLGELA